MIPEEEHKFVRGDTLYLNVGQAITAENADEVFIETIPKVHTDYQLTQKEEDMIQRIAGTVGTTLPKQEKIMEFIMAYSQSFGIPEWRTRQNLPSFREFLYGVYLHQHRMIYIRVHSVKHLISDVVTDAKVKLRDVWVFD